MWTSEIVPIKQSAGVLITMFGGWAVVLILGAVYFLLRNLLSPTFFMLCVAVLLLAVDIILFSWLRTRGARIFETL